MTRYNVNEKKSHEAKLNSFSHFVGRNKTLQNEIKVEPKEILFFNLCYLIAFAMHGLFFRIISVASLRI